MGCNCKHLEIIIGIVVVVFAWWGDSFVGMNASKWILVIAGVLLILHAWKCKSASCEMPTKGKASPKKKKK